MQRIFAHASIFDDFAAALSERAGRLRAGDPLLPETEVGPLISPAAVERIDAWVREAIAGGAILAAGGKRLGETLYAPTVLLEPPPEARVSTEEIFGPVTCVYRYRDLDEALARANRLPYAFQAAVFTRDLDTALRVADALCASGVMINDHTAFRTDWMPFAGLRQSGYGVGGVRPAMEAMTWEKLIVLRLARPR